MGNGDVVPENTSQDIQLVIIYGFTVLILGLRLFGVYCASQMTAWGWGSCRHGQKSPWEIYVATTHETNHALTSTLTGGRGVVLVVHEDSSGETSDVRTVSFS